MKVTIGILGAHPRSEDCGKKWRLLVWMEGMDTKYETVLTDKDLETTFTSTLDIPANEWKRIDRAARAQKGQSDAT